MRAHQKRLLDKGKIEKLVESLCSITSRDAEIAEKLSGEAAYFEKTSERMRHPSSGGNIFSLIWAVIEAGCKTVIGSRLKRSGMFWTARAEPQRPPLALR